MSRPCTALTSAGLRCQDEALPLGAFQLCRVCILDWSADAFAGLIESELRDLSHFSGDWGEVRQRRLLVLAELVEARREAGKGAA